MFCGCTETNSSAVHVKICSSRAACVAVRSPCNCASRAFRAATNCDNDFAVSLCPRNLSRNSPGLVTPLAFFNRWTADCISSAAAESCDARSAAACRDCSCGVATSRTNPRRSSRQLLASAHTRNRCECSYVRAVETRTCSPMAAARARACTSAD